jgi:cytidine deaminase
MCREALQELASAALPLLLVNPLGERTERTLGQLLPYPFELPPSR